MLSQDVDEVKNMRGMNNLTSEHEEGVCKTCGRSVYENRGIYVKQLGLYCRNCFAKWGDSFISRDTLPDEPQKIPPVNKIYTQGWSTFA